MSVSANDFADGTVLIGSQFSEQQTLEQLNAALKELGISDSFKKD
jgi:hypothetical protein